MSHFSFVRREVQRRSVFTPLKEELHDCGPLPSAGSDPERIGRLRRFIAAESPVERALLLLYLEEKPQKDCRNSWITPTNVSTKISRLKQWIRNEV